MCYWDTNCISLNRFKRSVLCVHTKRKPLQNSDSHVPWPEGEYNSSPLQGTGAVGKLWQRTTCISSPSPDNEVSRLGLPSGCQKQRSLDFFLIFFFEWNLINYCQLICNLWDNANEAYDFSSELNSKLLGLPRKCDKTGPVPPAGYVDLFWGQSTQTLAVPENGCFVQPELEGTCTWMIFNGDSASVVLLPTWN